jgi:hypothetical protein
MKNMKNILIDNDGDAIDLDKVSSISRLYKKTNQFTLSLICENTTHNLVFYVEDYVEDYDILYQKLSNIRKNIITRWANGNIDNTIYEPFININLNKNETDKK